MQTFLPYPTFEKSLRCLDRLRLGKQRVEAKQILDLVTGVKDNNWKNHPAVRMWMGYDEALKLYYNEALCEWERRGYKNDKLQKVSCYVKKYPTWLGSGKFHHSHRCNLMRKMPEHYSKFNWKYIDINAPYWWPKGLKNKKKQEEMIEYWWNYFERVTKGDKNCLITTEEITI